MGTSATLLGSARRIKEYNPALQVVEVQPTERIQAIEGLKHMGSSMRPGHYEPSFAERMVAVDADSAIREAHRVAKEEGLFVGASAVAAITVAAQLAGEIDRGVIVVILPDGGGRYLSTKMWE